MQPWKSVCKKLNETPFIARLFSSLAIIRDKEKVSDPEYQKGYIRCQNVNNFYTKLLKKIELGGGDRAIKRHTVTNKKMLIRDRIKQLLDPESPVLELAPLCGTELDYGNIPAGGSVCVIGKIHDCFCMVGGSDATVKGGAVYPIGVHKQLRMQTISNINNIPGIHMVDSAGAFLPLQADIFPDRNHGGRTFRNEAILSAKGTPQMALVLGSSTAGGAYAPTMTEEAIIVKGIGTIFLGGPPLVKAATGEIVSDQELGGADLHCRVSGCTDYLAETEVEAFELCRDIVESLNWIPAEEKFIANQEPLYDSSLLDSISGKMAITKEDTYLVISRIVDESKLKEFKKEFGKNLITGFSFIHGHLVGIVANCGPLSSADGLKGAHFVNLCDKRAIPLIFLQNSLGSEDSQTELWNDGEVIKNRAKMIAAHSCASVPKIVINIGSCLEDDNFTMCGASFKPNFIFSWPLAHTSLHDAPERSKLLELVLSEGDYTDNFFEEPTSAFHLSSLVLQDGIILPRDTRSVLAFCLEVAKSGLKNREAFDIRKKQVPMFRM